MARRSSNHSLIQFLAFFLPFFFLISAVKKFQIYASERGITYPNKGLITIIFSKIIEYENIINYCCAIWKLLRGQLISCRGNSLYFLVLE